MMIDLRSSAGPALIVGGGVIAARKAKALAEAEFPFTVVAPEIDPAIAVLPHVTCRMRQFMPTDVTAEPRWSLVFACTSSRATNREVGRLARVAGIPVVVADAEAESTFITPATMRDGDLAIAVSTGGASPTLARSIREQIVAALGPGWAGVVHRARTERKARIDASRRGRPE